MIVRYLCECLIFTYLEKCVLIILKYIELLFLLIMFYIKFEMYYSN
jgi:hypothetical protein